MSVMPMFPLGSVLFPGAVLPLQVFEPRYRELIADVRNGDSRFGVVLIERGPEVGGGDLRTSVGTMAEIVRMGEAEDGRILVVAMGQDRIRVVRWFEDDPYPRAAIELFPDTERNGRLDTAVDRALSTRRRLLALAIEMGAAGQSLDLDLPDDPVLASWVLCAAAPIGPFDHQVLLEAPSGVERMLTEQTDDLERALRETGDN